MTGSAGQFVYANLLSPIVLNANTTYYVLSQETSGGDQWYDFNTTATTGWVASLNGAVWGGGAPYAFVAGTAGRMYVPVDFKYTAVPPPPGGTSIRDLGTRGNGAQQLQRLGRNGDHGGQFADHRQFAGPDGGKSIRTTFLGLPWPVTICTDLTGTR